MQRVLQYLQARLDDPLDLVALAKVGGLSPRQLERVFTRTIGETPRACLRRIRLERAAARLRRTSRSILAVAVEAGFGSHEAFTRGFRARFGHTPAEYRRAARCDAQPRARLPLWRVAAASGLRPYLEGNALAPSREIGSV